MLLMLKWQNVKSTIFTNKTFKKFPRVITQSMITCMTTTAKPKYNLIWPAATGRFTSLVWGLWCWSPLRWHVCDWVLSFFPSLCLFSWWTPSFPAFTNIYHGPACMNIGCELLLKLTSVSAILKLTTVFSCWTGWTYSDNVHKSWDLILMFSPVPPVQFIWGEGHTSVRTCVKPTVLQLQLWDLSQLCYVGLVIVSSWCGLQCVLVSLSEGSCWVWLAMSLHELHVGINANNTEHRRYKKVWKLYLSFFLIPHDNWLWKKLSSDV